MSWMINVSLRNEGGEAAQSYKSKSQRDIRTFQHCCLSIVKLGLISALVMKMWFPWHFHSYFTVGQIKLSQWIFRSNDKVWFWRWSSSKGTDWCNLLLNRGSKAMKEIPILLSDWTSYRTFHGLPCGLVVQNLPANAGDTGSIPGVGRSPGEGNGDPYSRILVWRIPWTEKSGRLQSVGPQNSQIWLSG